MKKSTIMHTVSVVAAIWGVFALIGAWLAGENGTIFGFSQLHCFYDAIVLELISISAGVCALYRRQIENNS